MNDRRSQNAQDCLGSKGRLLREIDRGFVMDLYDDVPEPVRMRGVHCGDDRWTLYQDQDSFLLEFTELGESNQRIYRAVRLAQTPSKTQIGQEFLRRLSGWIGSVPQLSDFDSLRAI